MEPHTRAWRVAALAILSCLATECTKWHVDSLPPERVIAEKHPPKVKVVLFNEYTQVLESPPLRRDTLVGLERRGSVSRDRAIPLREVKSLASRRFSVVATTVLVGGITAAWILSRAAAHGVWQGLQE